MPGMGAGRQEPARRVLLVVADDVRGKPAVQAASITLDPDFRIGAIDSRMYGSCVEHIGRAIYGGIHEPEHPTADADGFRQDVLALVRELEVPFIRYPGGNFVSGYDWEDGVGPVGERPHRLDLAWMSTEPNRVGTNEFVRWAGLAGAEVNLAVNLGTRGIDAARNLVEYCNHPGGTHWSDLRRQHGVAAPHKIRTWCLGNEMDGPWQIGHKTATEYGRLAVEAAKVMKWVDPTIELVACGSSNSAMVTYPDWEVEVLDHCYEHVEYISLHTYYALVEDDLETFLARSLAMDEQIETVIAACDLVKARKRSRRTLMLSFDEWNVWYHSRPHDRALMRDDRWRIAPPLTEEAYTAADAVVVGSMLISLLKHADRVKIACLAQLVNALAPISTATGGGAWRQSTYYPFLHASRYGRGTALRLTIDSPAIANATFDRVPLLDAVAALDEERGNLTLFAVNRSLTDPLAVTARLGGHAGFRLVEHLQLTHADPHATNTLAAPATVVPTSVRDSTLDGDRLETRLAPMSWNMLRFSRGGAG